MPGYWAYRGWFRPVYGTKAGALWTLRHQMRVDFYFAMLLHRAGIVGGLRCLPVA